MTVSDWLFKEGACRFCGSTEHAASECRIPVLMVESISRAQRLVMVSDPKDPHHRTMRLREGDLIVLRP